MNTRVDEVSIVTKNTFGESIHQSTGVAVAGLNFVGSAISMDIL
jgi:hypothetical protein